MGIFKKGQKLYSVFNFKCPKCHEGNLFKTNTWSFKDITEMPESCEHCGQYYEPEPGFYFGAMFISYIFSGFFCLFFVMFFHWILDWGLESSFALLIAVCAIWFVWFWRFSRSVWINIVIHFDSKAKGLFQAKAKS